MKRARFVYYQEGPLIAGFPYAVYRDENNSDISAEELYRRGQPIPLTPTYSTWRNLVDTKKRCGKCFAYVRQRVSDLQFHRKVVHGL